MTNQRPSAVGTEPASPDAVRRGASSSGRPGHTNGAFWRWAVLGGIVVVVVVGGFLSMQWTTRWSDARKRASLIGHAIAIANTINVERAKVLSFTSADAQLPEFQRLRSQMVAYADAMRLRSLYSMGMRDGHIFFGPESLATNSPQASPPGTEYMEPSREDKEIFERRRPVVIGPQTDEYGTVISAIAPVLDPNSGRVIMVVGLDVEYDRWEASVNKMLVGPMAITAGLLVVLLGGAGALEWRRRRPDLSHGWLRHLEAVICAALGVLLTLAAVLAARTLENAERQDRFEKMAHAQADGASRPLLGVRDKLELLGRLFASDEVVDKKEFRDFTQPLVRDGLAQRWQWIPVVSYSRLAGLEADAKAQGMKGFFVWEKDSFGKHRPVAERDVYCPVFYAEPSESNDVVIGFDACTDKARQQAMDEAASTGLATAGNSITLLQYPGQKNGFILFHPVFYEGEAPRHLIGFVAAVLRWETVINSLVFRSGHSESDLSVDLYELEAGKDPGFLGSSSTNDLKLVHSGKGMKPPGKGARALYLPLFLGGRAFGMVIHTEPGFSGQVLLSGWIAGFVGGLLTVMLTGFFGMQGRRRAELERQVLDRTAALAQSEESYRRQFSENAAVMLLISAEDGRILDANARAVVFYGHSREKLISLRDAELSRLFPESVRESLASVTEERGSVLEFQQFPAEQPVREVEACVSRIQFGGREVLHLIVTDVTERKVAQRRLRDSEARQQAILAQITDVVAIMDEHGIIIYKSLGLEKRFGWQPTELLGAHFESTVHLDDRERLRQTFGKLLERAGATVTVEYMYRCRDGTFRPVEATAVNLIHDSGIRGVLVNYRDISKRREAEEALRENERKLTALLGNLPGMAYRCINDPQWTLTFVSVGCLELTGYSPLELKNNRRISYSQLIHPDDRDMVWEEVQASLPTRRNFELQYRILTASGQEKWVWESGIGVFSEDGELEALEGFIMDITQRRNAEQEMFNTLERSRKQHAVLAQVAISEAMVAGRVTEMTRQLTELASDTSGVERVSVWLFDESETELLCLDLFEASPRRHSSGMVLRQAEFANEFEALKSSKYVNADDAMTDSRTAGYRESYLQPLGITSMLDAVIRMGGKTLGVLCFEHVLKPHIWKPDEIAFASQLGDQIAITLLNQHRRQAEDELRESEVKHRVLFLNAPEPYQIMLDGVFVECNRATEVMMRGSRDQIVGMRPEALSPEFQPNGMSSADAVKHNTVTAFRNGSVAFEWKHRRLDGSDLIVEVSIVPMDWEGKAALFTAWRDITERKKAEEELRESETRFRTLVENIPQKIFIKDRDLRWVSANENFARDVGKTTSELLGLTDFDLFPRDMAEKYRADDFRIIETGRSESYEQRNSLHGRDFWEHVVKIPVRDPQGAITGVFASFWDITERKLAADALRESEERYRTILNASPDGVAISNLSGCLTMVSPGGAKMFGYENPKQMIGMKVSDCVVPEDRERAMFNVGLILQRQPPGPIEYGGLRADGSRFIMEANGEAILDSDGRPFQMVSIVRDITDRKRVEAELKQKGRQLRDLFDNAPVGICHSTLDGRFVVANPALAALLGYDTPEELTIATAEFSVERQIYATPAARQQVVEDMLKAEGWLHHKEVRWRRKDGCEITVDITGRKVLDQAGEFAYFEAFIEDITERKRATEELKASEEQHRLLLQSMPVGVVVHALDTSIAFANEAACRMLGLTPEQIAGRVAIDPEWRFLRQDGTTMPLEEYPVRRVLDSRKQVDDILGGIRRGAGKETIWIFGNGFPLFDDKGQMQQVVVAFVDITARKLAEEKVRDAQARAQELLAMAEISAAELRQAQTETKSYLAAAELSHRTMLGVLEDQQRDQEALVQAQATLQTAMDCSPAGIAIADAPSGRLRYVNRAGLLIGGGSEEDLVHGVDLNKYVASWNICDLDRKPLAPEEVPLAWAIQKGEPYSREFIILRAVGDERIVLANAAPVLDPQGKVTAGMVVFMDITDRKRAEAAQRMVEARFQEFMAHLPAAVFIKDAFGRTLFANRYYLELPHWQEKNSPEAAKSGAPATPDQLPNGSTHLLAGDHARRMTSEELEALVGNPVIAEETLIAPNGESRVFQTIRFAILVPDQPAMLGGIALDITARKSAEEEVKRLNQNLEHRVRERTAQLEASNRELEAFSYSVSHDLRSPLRAISGFARLLHKEHSTRLEAEGLRLLGVVSSEAHRMGTLIDDLLTFSRLGRQPVERSTVNLETMVRGIFSDLVLATPERKLHLEVATMPSAQADPSLLRQVLVNLISNAIKYTRPVAEARIEVGSRLGIPPTPAEAGGSGSGTAKPEGAVLREETIYFVRDNGVGFDMRYVGKLFGVFQRLHSESEFEGTGVGLALSQRIIHRHGGRIWAESKLGEGTTFSFTLPLGRAEK